MSHTRWRIAASMVLALAVIVAGILVLSSRTKESIIFIPSQTLPPTEDREPQVSLLAVGDIMMSRSVGLAIRQANNFDYPFEKIKEAFAGGDIIFANLESPIISGRAVQPGEMSFRMDPGVEQALQKINVNVVSLANNHTPNWGAQGLKDTFKYLTAAGILYVGAGEDDIRANEPKYITRNGITFAFLAYNDPSVVPVNYEAASSHFGTAFTRIDKMTAAVREAKQQADFVVVSMHDGTEYVQKLSDTQINFAHAAIDAGAELVIGHHPHVVQRVEEYKGKYILYSLGNFVFDQQWSEQTKEGAMVKIIFNKKGMQHISFLPVYISVVGQPVVATSTAASHVINKLAVPLVKEKWAGESDVAGWGITP